MESLTIAAIFEMVGVTFSALPDSRKGKNRAYEMANAAAGAFGVSFTLSPSFLAYQRDTERNKGQNNYVNQVPLRAGADALLVNWLRSPFIVQMPVNDPTSINNQRDAPTEELPEFGVVRLLA